MFEGCVELAPSHSHRHRGKAGPTTDISCGMDEEIPSFLLTLTVCGKWKNSSWGRKSRRKSPTCHQLHINTSPGQPSRADPWRGGVVLECDRAGPSTCLNCGDVGKEERKMMPRWESWPRWGHESRPCASFGQQLDGGGTGDLPQGYKLERAGPTTCLS